MRSEKGFTLIEVMASMAIFSVIILVVMGFWQQVSKMKRRGEEQAEQVHMVRTAMDRMMHDFASAYLSKNQPYGTEKTPRTYFEAIPKRDGVDEVRFTFLNHFSHAPENKEGDASEVTYYGESSLNTPGKFRLMRKENRRIQMRDFTEKNPMQAEEAVVLCENVVRLEIRYFLFDLTHKEWIDSWSTTKLSAPTSDLLPLRVRITLTISEQEQPQQTARQQASIFPDKTKEYQLTSEVNTWLRQPIVY